MSDGLTIEFSTDDTTDQRRTKVAAAAEGAVQVNMAEMEEGGVSVGELSYEHPRHGPNKNQRIGSVKEVSRRGKATCLDIACIFCAAERRAGRQCFVRIISTKSHERVIPFTYHAVVQYPDGTIFDASELLTGYNKAGEWWQRKGHCCPSCALDEPCLGAEGGCACGGKH